MEIKALSEAYTLIGQAKRLLSRNETPSLWASCVELQDDINAQMSYEYKARDIAARMAKIENDAR